MNWVKLQRDAAPDDQLIYSIVGWHALTLPQDPKALSAARRDSRWGWGAWGAWGWGGIDRARGRTSGTYRVDVGIWACEPFEERCACVDDANPVVDAPDAVQERSKGKDGLISR